MAYVGNLGSSPKGTQLFPLSEVLKHPGSICTEVTVVEAINSRWFKIGIDHLNATSNSVCRHRKWQREANLQSWVASGRGWHWQWLRSGFWMTLIYPPGNQHIPPREKENHLQKCLGRGYVGSLEGTQETPLITTHSEFEKRGQMLEYPSSNNSMMVRVSHHEAAGMRAQLSMSILWPVGWPVGIDMLSGVLVGCPANKYVASCWFTSVPFWKPSGKTHPITPSSKLRRPSRKNAGIQHQLRSLTIVAEDDVPCLQQIQWSAG